MKPCKVCKLHGVRITPAYRHIDTEYVACANPDCPIYDKKIPIEIWQAGTYKVQMKKQLRDTKRNSLYRRLIEVSYE